MMTETIDYTQWISRGAPVVSAFRMQHGDLQGYIKGEGAAKRIAQAWCPDPTIMGWMIEKGFIDEAHRAAALALLELRRAVFGHLDFRFNSAFLSMKEIGEIKEKDVPDIYGAVYSTIKRRGERLVVQAATYIANDHKNLCNALCANIYRVEFEVLLKAMDCVKKTLEQRESV